MQSLVLFLILIFAGLYAFLAHRNFLLALCFLVFALPSYLIRFEYGGIPSNMLEVMIAVIFLIHIISVFRHEGFEKIKAQLKNPSRDFLFLRVAMGLFFLAGIVAVFTAPDFTAALGLWHAYVLEAMLVGIVVVQSMKNKRDAEKIMMSFGLSVLTLFVFGLYQKITGWKLDPIYLIDGRVDRITSVYGFPNAIGLYLAPILVWYAGWAFQTACDWLKNKERQQFLLLLFQTAVFVSGLISIVLAKSEGAIVAVLVSLFAGGLLLKKTRLFTLVFTSVVFAAIFLIPQTREYTVAKLSFSGWSEQVRLYIWKESFAMIKDHPVFGAGFSGYPTVFEPYHATRGAIEIFQYPHQIVLNFWSEMGLLGLFAWILICIAYMKMCLVIYKNEETKMLAVSFFMFLLAMWVHGLVDVPYFKNDLSVQFWVITGLLIFLNHQNNLQKI